MKIPFLDLVAQGQPLKDDILAMVGDAIDEEFVDPTRVDAFAAKLILETWLND